MKILFAQADAANLTMIETVLSAEGHELISAIDGNDAMLALQENPDLIILDSSLPEISGFECCRLIKHKDQHRHTPVVLLMPTADATAWARYSECAADNFMELPLHPNVIKAKIKQLLKMKELYQRLENIQHHAEQEIRLAKHMFDSITKQHPKEIDFMNYWGLSAGHFCGDLFIFERTPDHHLHVFLGDFTGHGLAAAMSALPVSDVFFSMTRNGDTVAHIIETLNRKLYEIMPTGKFCAATLLRLDADYTRLEIWSGGLPPLLLIDNQHKIASQCESFHLPLGITEPAEFSSQTRTIQLAGIQSVVIYSDGLIEAQNSAGECFGEARLAHVIARKVGDHCVFNRIKSSTLAFLEGLEPHDDVSLAVINLN